MADDADKAGDLIERTMAATIARASRLADLPKGETGECDLCGEESRRLIDGVCAPCRDRYKLK